MVEVPPPSATASWQASSASGSAGTACVQVTYDDEHLWVRDSKNSRGPILGLTHVAWAAFLSGVQRGEIVRAASGV